MPKWFRRFGDIPGVVYEMPDQIDRGSLPGCDDAPENQPWDQTGETLRGRRRRSPWEGWLLILHYRAFARAPDQREVPVEAIVRKLSPGS